MPLTTFLHSVGEKTSDLTPSALIFNQLENSMFLNPVDHREVNKIIKSLKPKRSHGIDELPPILIKACADELTLPFCLLINQSFAEGVFPDLLKQSLIKPIHKKNKKSDPSNYRPIALLPTASKIIEKAMCDRVYKFCEKYKIFNSRQHGFRKKHSTILATYQYNIQEACNIINDHKYAIGLLLDLSKAYDTVQYSTLLNKLHGVGIRGIAYQWFKSYLCNRAQLVEIEYYNKNNKKIENIRSQNKTINASIPQGSVLGCVLFLLYINDLPTVIQDHCVMFADDISILTSTSDISNLTENLTRILDRIIDWMKVHNLHINFQKTKIIPFYPYQKAPIQFQFSYKNIPIETTYDFSLLGLMIDTHLNWKTHVEKIRKKMSSFSFALHEIKKTTNVRTAIVTYYAYAYSWLSYGIILWGNSTDIHSFCSSYRKSS